MKPTITPSEVELRMATMVGWFVDVQNEDKYLVREGGVEEWVGPGAATDCEMRLWTLWMANIVLAEAKGALETLAAPLAKPWYTI